MFLSTEGLEVGQLDEDRMAAFLLARHETGHPRVPGRRAMAPLLGCLREVGVTAAGRPPLTPLDALLGRYRSWMVRERNLAPSMVLRYENTARRFLLEQVSDGETFEPAALTGIDINAFLLRECGRVSTGSAKPGTAVVVATVPPPAWPGVRYFPTSSGRAMVAAARSGHHRP